MRLVDSVKQGTGTALMLRAAAIPKESRQGLAKQQQPSCLSTFADTDVSSGATVRPVDSTSVAAASAVTVSLGSMASGSGVLGSNPTPATFLQCDLEQVD